MAVQIYALTLRWSSVIDPLFAKITAHRRELTQSLWARHSDPTVCISISTLYPLVLMHRAANHRVCARMPILLQDGRSGRLICHLIQRIYRGDGVNAS